MLLQSQTSEAVSRVELVTLEVVAEILEAKTILKSLTAKLAGEGTPFLAIRPLVEIPMQTDIRKNPGLRRSSRVQLIEAQTLLANHTL